MLPHCATKADQTNVNKYIYSSQSFNWKRSEVRYILDFLFDSSEKKHSKWHIKYWVIFIKQNFLQYDFYCFHLSLFVGFDLTQPCTVFQRYKTVSKRVTYYFWNMNVNYSHLILMFSFNVQYYRNWWLILDLRFRFYSIFIKTEFLRINDSSDYFSSEINFRFLINSSKQWWFGKTTVEGRFKKKQRESNTERTLEIK